MEDLSDFAEISGTYSRLISLDVPNIHDMRFSWEKLQDLVGRTDLAERMWLQCLGETFWLDHCRRITEAGVTVARALMRMTDNDPASCILVHCSDGWDRTAQICALAQLLVDPRFRTRRGFAQLVEKDWVGFGHRFAERCVTRKGPKAGPIFLQFLFCVSAIVEQFPSEFEFGSRDLQLLADLSLCGAVGTFAHNNEREANAANASQTQVSVWALWLETNKHESYGAVKRARLTLIAQSLVQPQISEHVNLSRASVCTEGHGAGRRASFLEHASLAPELRVGAQPSSRRASLDNLRAPQPSSTFLGSSFANDLAFPIVHLLLPVTSLKRFALWDWALRFDEVAFSRENRRVGARAKSFQRLSHHTVVMLRNSAAPECMDCKGEFGVLRRRHHCSGCGLLFCFTCLQLPDESFEGDSTSRWLFCFKEVFRNSHLNCVCRRCHILNSSHNNALKSRGFALLAR